MKYWIFQNNEVCGPYDADDLAQLPGYSAETLVCPEGRKGTRMGDWQRAGMVPALSLSLVKATQLSPVGKGVSPASAVYAGLPPEPTLKDLAALGSLQEKVSLLEGTIAQFQEGLQSKETELLSLHREIDVRKGIEADLEGKLRELESQLAAVAQLRETIDGAVAAEKSVESEVKSVETEVKNVENAVHGVASTVEDVKTSMNGVSSTVKDLEASLLKQTQTIGDLRGEIDRLKSERGAALQSAPALPRPGLVIPEPTPLPPMGASEPPALKLGPAPAFEAPLAPQPAAFVPAPLAPQPAPAAVVPPEPFKLEAPPPLAALGASAAVPPAALFPGQPAPIPPFGAEAAPAATPAAPTGPKPPLAKAPADLAQPKSSSKKGLVLALASFGLVAGGVLAFQAGLIPGLRRPARSQATAEPAAAAPAAPAAGITPQAPSPEAQLEELKGKAIDLVKSWPSSDKITLVGQRLEASAPAGANPALSWMAEKLGDGVFQVNYYGGKQADGRPAVFMFQANVAERTVTPYSDDAAAKTLLFGAPVPGRKVRVKPKQVVAQAPKAPKARKAKAAAPAADSSLAALPGFGQAPAAAAAAPAAPAPASADAQQAPPPHQQAPAVAPAPAAPTEKPARKAPRRQATEEKKPKPADDAQLLDQLLE